MPEVHGRDWPGRDDIKASNWRARRRSTQYDCVVIVTDHKAFDYEAMVAEADLIVDTRNAIKTAAPPRVPARRPAAARSAGERRRVC